MIAFNGTRLLFTLALCLAEKFTGNMSLSGDHSVEMIVLGLAANLKSS